MSGWRRVTCAVVATLVGVLISHPALAQAHNPFGVGISEGGGSASGITGWLLNEQAMFERQLSAAVRATRTDSGAVPWLVGLSFLYGVFHAAGPGHGKAVMASYLFANERALRRGMVLSLMAALLQGAVAVALVAVLALVLHATALRMKDAASLVESLSYAGIAVLGAWLVWQKGRRFVAALGALRPAANPLAFATAGGVSSLRFSPTPPASRPARTATADNRTAYAMDAGCACAVPGAFSADDGHGTACSHRHGPDPRTLGDGFSWREAILTVVAAGARPCSGAILVLVFALAQGLFAVGVAAVVAMSLGTAITTGALAAVAVLAKTVAVRLSRPGSRRGTAMLRGLEVLAALVVLLAGLSLLIGTATRGGA